MRKVLSALVLLLALAAPAKAQADFGGIARLDATVHDFGSVNIKDGPVSYTFTLTNISSSPIIIQAVTSTCSCTSATWTRESLEAGASGEITARYTNDEGPYPFDKTLFVYVSGLERPIVLHIKGSSFDGGKKKKKR